MPKTTEEHFKIFKEECEYWLERYQFGDFDIAFLHANREKKNSGLAWQVADHEDKWTLLGLFQNWSGEEPCNEYKIRQLAFHEVNELMVDELNDLAIERYNITKERINGARHSVINRIDKAFFRQSLKDRGLLCT